MYGTPRTDADTHFQLPIYKIFQILCLTNVFQANITGFKRA